MKWYRGLYLGEGITKSEEQMIRKLETNAGLPGVYLVTLSSNGKNLLDIFSANYLLQPVLHGLCPMIVGLAKGWEEAVDLASRIVLEAYENSGSFDVNAYLQERLGAGQELAYEYPMEHLKRRTHWGLGTIKLRK